MRGDVRSIVVVVLGLVAVVATVAGMRLVLPAVVRQNEQRLLGANYERVEAQGLEVWAPRRSGLGGWLARWFGAFTRALYRTHGRQLRLRPVEDKIVVRVFATQPELVRFARKRMKQDLSHAGGFYDPASWSIALTLLPREKLLPLLFHEATHLVMDRSALAGPPEWSTWLAEGMAEIAIEAARERGVKAVALSGGVMVNRAIVSAILRKLKEAGLVREERKEGFSFYSLDRERVAQTLEELRTLLLGGR